MSGKLEHANRHSLFFTKVGINNYKLLEMLTVIKAMVMEPVAGDIGN